MSDKQDTGFRDLAGANLTPFVVDFGVNASVFCQKDSLKYLKNAEFIFDVIPGNLDPDSKQLKGTFNYEFEEIPIGMIEIQLNFEGK